MASFVTNQYRGRLSTLHGATLTVALMDSTYIGGADDTDLSSVSGEVDAQDAPGYTRQTVTGVWDPVDGVLRWDTAPSFDAAGADEIQTVLIADDQGDIVAGLVWSTPVAGVDGMIPEVDHLAAITDEAGVVARLDDHETRIAALENGPGGPGGSTGEIAELASTGEPAGLIAVTDGTGGVTLDPVPTGGGGGSLSWESWPSGPHLPTVAVVGDMPTGDTPPTTPAGLVRFVDSMVDTALVDDDEPMILGTIAPDHRPFGEMGVYAMVQWLDPSDLSFGQAVVVVAEDGTVMAMDLSKTLTDSDEVLLPLAGIEWLTLMGAH